MESCQFLVVAVRIIIQHKAGGESDYYYSRFTMNEVAPSTWTSKTSAGTNRDRRHCEVQTAGKRDFG